MYKNVSLRKREVDGRTTWKLLGPDGQPIAAFDAYAHSLRTSPKNTRAAYCRHVAEFFDYMIEVADVVARGWQLTKLELSEAIDAYWDYLRMGPRAAAEIARDVAARMAPGANAGGSIVPKKASVRRFLNLSEEVRKELAELARMRGEPAASVDNAPLLPDLGKRRELQPYEVRAMQANSMLAGVIAGGPRFVDSIVIGDADDTFVYDERRAFPYDKAMVNRPGFPRHP